MRLSALRARPRRRRLPNDIGGRPTPELVANVLDRQFEAAQPNRQWVADFIYRLHLYLYGGRPALRGGGARALLAPVRRLVDERHYDGRTRHRRADDNRLAPGTAARAVASLGTVRFVLVISQQLHR